MLEGKTALSIMALATASITSLSAGNEGEVTSCAEGSLSGLCLCFAAVIDSKCATLSLDFFATDSIWYEICADFKRLSKREDEGSYARVVNNPDCHFGCYRDEQFCAPRGNEGCDLGSLESLQGMQGIEFIMECLEVGQQPAPRDVTLCNWYQELDVEEMVLPTLSEATIITTLILNSPKNRTLDSGDCRHSASFMNTRFDTQLPPQEGGRCN